MDFDPALLQRLPFEMVDHLIAEFGLHESWPVNLAPLYKGMSIRTYHDIILPGKLPAFSMLHARQGHGIAVFSAGLPEQALSHAMGHEMGHLLYNKVGRANGCITSPQGVVLKEETEADWLASYLMVPGKVFYHLSNEGYDLGEIATLLQVPQEMLEIRATIMIARDEIANW